MANGSVLNGGYSKLSLALLVGVGGFGYSAIMALGYFNQTYYSLFQEGIGFSDVQIGVLISIIGTVALFGYFFGGIVSDIFRTKFLMVISHIGATIIGVGMAMLPSYKVMVVLQFLIAIFSIFTYWAPMAKFVRSLGPKAIEGKLYGFFYMCVGLGGTVVGFIATAIIARTNSVTGLQALLYMYAGVNLLAAIVILLLYKEPDPTEVSEGDKFHIRYVLEILKMPEIWLLGIAGFAGYLINVATSYFNPLLTSSFAVSVGMMTALATIRSYIIRLTITPVSGVVIDKAKGSTKLMQYLLVSMFVVMLTILFMPWSPKWAVIAIIAMIVLAIVYNFLTPTWFTPLTDIGIPDKMRGTAVGITNAIIFSSDAFMYSVVGGLISKYGEGGYKIMFGLLAIAAVIGFLCITIIRKRLAGKNPSASVTA